MSSVARPVLARRTVSRPRGRCSLAAKVNLAGQWGGCGRHAVGPAHVGLNELYCMCNTSTLALCAHGPSVGLLWQDARLGPREALHGARWRVWVSSASATHLFFWPRCKWRTFRGLAFLATHGSSACGRRDPERAGRGREVLVERKGTKAEEGLAQLEARV